jgi:N-acetylmuramoyl-L-alanine amidase
VVLATAACVLAADAPAPVTLSAMRSWSAPTGTRVVLDFSKSVTVVVPDSGITNQLVVSLPGEPLSLAASVPLVLGVRDGVVDSVQVVTRDETGAQFRLWFHASTRFRVFSLPAEADRPFRLVVDVARPGGEAAEEKRLDKIAETRKTERVRVVAVDPGHGGEDTGARGPHRVLEKNVNLAIARALVDELNQRPQIRAFLTRLGDYFVPLRERYQIAERAKADLFISIHANSTPRRGSGSGTEVYFLSLRGASDQADDDLANTENAADLVGGVPPQSDEDLVSILYDVKRSSALQQSQLLAASLLENLAVDRRIETRGVKQAGFRVLKSVEFPSVLVETAFINNPVEARLLANPDFQKKMGKQLSTGVASYFQRAGINLGSSAESTSMGQDH